MIIKNDFFNEKRNYLEEEKKGLDRAVENFVKRYEKGEVKKENFLKQNEEYAKRQKALNEKIKKGR